MAVGGAVGSRPARNRRQEGPRDGHTVKQSIIVDLRGFANLRRASRDDFFDDVAVNIR